MYSKLTRTLLTISANKVDVQKWKILNTLCEAFYCRGHTSYETISQPVDTTYLGRFQVLWAKKLKKKSDKEKEMFDFIGHTAYQKKKSCISTVFGFKKAFFKPKMW